jgi:hypothetical protein
MACPGCLVAVAGTDGLGADTSCESSARAALILGLVGGALGGGFLMYLAMARMLQKGYGANRRRRRR